MILIYFFTNSYRTRKSRTPTLCIKSDDNESGLAEDKTEYEYYWSLFTLKVGLGAYIVFVLLMLTESIYQNEPSVSFVFFLYKLLNTLWYVIFCITGKSFCLYSLDRLNYPLIFLEKLILIRNEKV